MPGLRAKRRALPAEAQLAILPATALAALILAPAAARADDVEPIRIAFEAPSGCSSEASFLDEVRARTAKARLAAPGEKARSFTVQVKREGRRVRGRLTLEEAGGAPAVRDVRGDRCDEIVSAL